MNEAWHALSVKQPWAALLALGRKSIEVRTWGVSRRGKVLIHAAKIDDPRPQGWAALDTPELKSLAERRGGILGVADFVECLRYDTPEAFAADGDQHRNAPEWFRPPRLFGFVFANPRPVPFEPWPGNTFFFAVPGYTLPEAPEAPAAPIIWIDPPEGPRKGFSAT